MAAKVLDLTAYRRKRPVVKRSKSDVEADIIDLYSYRLQRIVRKSGNRLKGLGYPDDHMVGYDEPMIDDKMENYLMRTIFGDDWDSEDE